MGSDLSSYGRVLSNRVVIELGVSRKKKNEEKKNEEKKNEEEKKDEKRSTTDLRSNFIAPSDGTNRLSYDRRPTTLLTVV